MSAMVRDETSVFRHASVGCVVCGTPLERAATGRRRLFCSPACRQRAYRLRLEARSRRDDALPADPAEVSRLLAAVLGQARRR
jgi:predicted nucleic acid-binding Zn ribbon protein